MLQGNKTFLRPLEIDDISLYKKWYNDQEVNYWANGAWPLSTMLGEGEIEERYFLPRESSGRYIILNELEVPIGTIGFREMNIPARSATLFVIIGEKEYWGQGYGTDALKVLVD